MQANPARSRALRPSLLCAVLLLAAGGSAAQPQLPPPVEEPQAREQPPPPGSTLRGDSPQASLRGFLEAMRAGDDARAASYLDLRFLSPERREREGPELARKLKYALDHSLWVEPDALSPEAEGAQDDGLPPRQDLLGTVAAADRPVDVLLERMPEGVAPRWRFAASTVRQVPALHAAFGPSPIEAFVPEPLRRWRWLELALWQWIAILALAGVSAALSFAVVFALLRVARRLVFLRTPHPETEPDPYALLRWPLRLSVSVAVFAAALGVLSLPVPAERLLWGMVRGFLVVAATWLALRVVDGVAGHVDARFRALGKLPASAAVPLVRRVAKAVLMLMAAIAVAGNLGLDVTGVIAGLGIGGLAVALAAQKSVENLFGGLTLITDQPVRGGDFCRVGGWIGTVEDVGLRSTRIRTLDRTVLTIPNASFAAMELENYTRRDRIFFHPILNLRYETTPDQLRWLLVALKRLLVAHPMVLPEPARARFIGLGAHSLDVEIFAYVRTTDYDEFLAVQEDLLLRIMELVEESGSGFAFPSQTVYAAPDPGLNEERSRTAAEQVRAWREHQRLPLPWPPRGDLDAWRDSLDYPPQGAAVPDGGRGA